MKKLSTFALAASIAFIAVFSSSSVFATQNGMRAQQAQKGQLMKHKNHHKHHGKGHRMKNRKDVPAPIPGLLALAAAAGGGVILRRKAKKAKSQDTA